MKYRNYYCAPKYSKGDKTYYGNVADIPEIPMIEADNLEDFERLFHQAVDGYLDERAPKPKTKSEVIFTLLVVLCILITMVVTCPKKEQHVKVLTEKITNILSDSVGEEEDIKFLGSMVGRAFTKPILDNLLVVDDDVFFSVGHLEYEGEDHFLSLGVFGHVFTVSKEQVKRRMKQNKD